LKEQEIYIAIMTTSTESMSWSQSSMLGATTDLENFYKEKWFKSIPDDIKAIIKGNLEKHDWCQDIDWRIASQNRYTDYTLTIERTRIL
jgi:hypothetical protein